MSWEYNNYLAHFGIFGMRWGVRRYQNEDGTLTEEGKKHYSKKLQNDIPNSFRNQAKIYNEAIRRHREEVNAINEKYHGKVDIMQNHPTKATLDYVKEINKTWKHDYENAAYEMFGKDNPMWDKKVLELSYGYNSYQELEDDLINRRKGKQSIYEGTHD